MDKFFSWLSQNPIATNTLIIAFGVLVSSLVLIYTVAFFQGRSVSFWPPKIGEKPPREKNNRGKNSNSENTQTACFNPIIQKGTLLETSSGNKLTVESNFYGGATATLFKAKNPNDEKRIVKVYWRGLRPNSPPWEQFNREYRTSEILVHHNIVKVLGRGLFSGYPFVVMEFLPGGTLRDLLQSRSIIPGKEVISIAEQIANAIDYAHTNGVVHRDIKPGNILFENNSHGRIALSDFGIAKILGAVERDITADEGFVGSPGYISPEAIKGNEVTKACDIYSFGVVLFEMIAGRIPFNEFQGFGGILNAKLNEDATDIREYRPVSEKLANRLAQTLSRKPNERPISTKAVLFGIENEIKEL